MKTIAFRADAGTEIGTGHVMRCLTLADMLQKQGAAIFFICRDMPENLIELIVKRGYRVALLPSHSDDMMDTYQILQENKVHCLIVDHYQIDEKWEKQMKAVTDKIIVIDDLANRPHDCDGLLDQNYYEAMESRYRELIPETCEAFLGPQYLLLRPEFLEAQRVSQERDGRIRRLLIFYGGSDPTRETEKALQVLQSMNLSGIHVDVVTGNANPSRNHLRSMCHKMGAVYHCQIDYLADLMAKADFAFGAGGVAMWERCYLGLPTLTTIVADNQLQSVRAAAKYGAVYSLGWHTNVTKSVLADSLNQALYSPDLLKKMSERAIKLTRSGTQDDIHPVVRFILGGDQHAKSNQH